MTNKADSFILGYLHKTAAPVQGQPSQNVPRPHMSNQQAAQAAMGQEGMIDSWANNADPTNRAWGEGATAGGLGAAAGYMMGGDAGSAAMGGALGSLLYYLANTFFGKDMQKARTFIDMKVKQGTLDQFGKQLKEQTGQDLDMKAVKSEMEVVRLKEQLPGVTDAGQLAEIHKQIDKHTKDSQGTASLGQQMNIDVDNNQNGIDDRFETWNKQQGTQTTAPTTAPQVTAPQATTAPSAPMTQFRPEVAAKVTQQPQTASTQEALPGKPLGQKTL